MINIYKITNLINGKVYIGRTKNSIEHRFKQHVGMSKRLKVNSNLAKAIVKYGKQNFKTELLASVEERKAAQAETDYILLYRSHLSEYGYNLTWTSSGCGLQELKKITAIKLSSASKNYWNSLTPEDKIKIGLQRSKRLKGIPKSTKHKEVASKNRRGISTSKHKTSRFLGVCLRSNKEWRASIYYHGKSWEKVCAGELEAAEAYDKMAVFFFGERERLNFPQKYCDYITMDLRAFCQRKTCKSKFKSIWFHDSPRYWTVYHKKQYLGKYESESEAVKRLSEFLNIPIDSLPLRKERPFFQEGIKSI